MRSHFLRPVFGFYIALPAVRYGGIAGFTGRCSEYSTPVLPGDACWENTKARSMMKDNERVNDKAYALTSTLLRRVIEYITVGFKS